MSTDPYVASCLELIAEISDDVVREIRLLSPDEAWRTPTNCPTWQVRDLAVHLVVSGESFAASIRNGLAGSLQPPAPETNADRQAELLATDPATVADALQSGTVSFVELCDGLEEPQLSAICFHRRGNRPVRWYIAHRLAELAFHSWDLQLSMGRDPVMPERVAALLLPMLLESNLPRTYAAGLSDERGKGERYLLAVRDDPSARWLLTIGPERLDVKPAPPRSSLIPTDHLLVTGSPTALALLVYGRRSLRNLARAGEVGLHGDLSHIERFGEILPRP